MNPNTASQMTSVQMTDDDEIDLGRLLSALLDAKGLIAAVTLGVTLLGVAYTQLATPIYEANLLLQVEDNGPNAGKGMLAEAAAMFDVKTEAAAEIEIIKSRMVVGKPVDALRLDLDIQPLRLPLIGRAIAARNDKLSTPGLLGIGHSTWGAESIDVQRFELPAKAYGKAYTLIAGPSGQYTLQDPVTGQQHRGQVGQLLSFAGAGGNVELLVHALHAQEGAGFSLVRKTRLSQIEALQARLKVTEQGKRSGIINVTLRGDNPQQVVDTLNTIGAEYVRQNIERKSEEADKTLKFLDVQLPELKRELEAAEARYNNFRNRNGVVDLSEEAKSLLSVSVQAQSRIAEIQQKRIEAAARFQASHPVLQALDTQLRQAQKDIGQVNTQIKRLPIIEQDMLRLTRDMKVSTDLYASLLESTQQLKLVKAGKIGNVRVIDAAVVPDEPEQPKKPLILAVSLMLGLLLGCGLVLVRRSLRNAIESVEELETRSGVSVYATVPQSKRQKQIDQMRQAGQSSPLLAQAQSDDPAIETLRSFMTALQFAMAGNPNNVVLITGAMPGVGKSFVSANFAAVLANSGKRVLLIDGDLRKGYLHEYFGGPSQRSLGLSEILAGQATLAQATLSQVLPGLDFVGTGKLPPNPAELLRTPQLPALLAEASARYELVIIDSAPVLPVPDTAILAPLAGSTVVVVRDGHSTLPEVTETAKRLTQVGVRITCGVFNGLLPRSHAYGAYAYRYGYGYGSSPESATISLGWAARVRRLMGRWMRRD